MRRLSRIATIVVLGIGIAASAAQAQNSASYSPSAHSIAGTIAFTDTYALQVTSPANLNANGTTRINGAGIETEMRVTALSWPDGSSAAAAEALVSFSVPTLLFTALNQAQSVNVTFTATGSTIPGDYSYAIQAAPPGGLGWGVGNHTLNVEVSEPTAVDLTPPNVSITAPIDGTSLVFCAAGVAVPVTVTAIDAESVVTSVAADVNGSPLVLSFAAGHNVTATGSFTASGVGVYSVNASATSAGGTGNASQVSVTVQYNTIWLPPLALGKTGKGGSTVPVKVTARDCTGAFVHDESVRITVHEGAALKLDALFGESADSVRIDDIDGHYITNFQTESGPHTYTVNVYFNGLLHTSRNFSVR
jgi:hypothetical protein